MPRFERDKLSFFYRDEGRGLPFVFQHGLGGDCEQTFGLLSPVESFRLLTLDCRGHGETRPVGDENRISIPQFADDVRSWLDHLGVQRAVLGGISMGAATALHFALTHPERTLGLVLSRPAWLDRPRNSGFEIFGEIARLLRKHGPHEGSMVFQNSPAYASISRDSPDNAKSLLDQFVHPRALETVAKLEIIPAYQPQFTRESWRKISVPTLVLANRMDRIHPSEYGEVLAREIPGAEFREVTPKSVSRDRYEFESRKFITEFVQTRVNSFDPQ
jgi:pimeloyl-ACP methyl ester carboxylesterase